MALALVVFTVGCNVWFGKLRASLDVRRFYYDVCFAAVASDGR